jgi:tryptophanyl-tRNA synthetase
MTLDVTTAGAAESRPVIFSDEYYRSTLREHGYETFELDRFTFPLADLSANELNVRWLCHHRATKFVATPADRRVVTTGFGMSGVPHMGTVSQILGITRLQAGGERCQIVLGDLDAHNGKGRPLGQTRELADRYAAFCRRLGFNDTAGVLRAQFDDIDALRNLYLLGHYADDSDFDHAEEDNHGYYAALGIVDGRMTFRRKVSLALMASDFLTLGQTFDAVLVMLGLDEHKYVRFAADVAGRLDARTSLRGEFSLAAIYSRLTVGFGGHPKMSKSIPGSSISVDSTPDQIVARVMTDDATTPETSPSYQLICQTFLRPYDECLALIDECASGTRAWTKAKRELADYLISIAALWWRRRIRVR